jgi:hypothetical protein
MGVTAIFYEVIFYHMNNLIDLIDSLRWLFEPINKKFKAPKNIDKEIIINKYFHT